MFVRCHPRFQSLLWPLSDALMEWPRQPRPMERFAVKRGVMKSIGGNAGLIEVAGRYFDDVRPDTTGGFTGSKAILSVVCGHFDEKGRLVVDTEQMRGEDLRAFLDRMVEETPPWRPEVRGPVSWMRSRDTLPWQRGDKAKEAAKKMSKSRSAVKLARNFMEKVDLPPERRAVVEDLIAQVEEQIEANEEARAFSLSEKLNAALES